MNLKLGVCFTWKMFSVGYKSIWKLSRIYPFSLGAGGRVVGCVGRVNDDKIETQRPKDDKEMRYTVSWIFLLLFQWTTAYTTRIKRPPHWLRFRDSTEKFGHNFDDQIVWYSPLISQCMYCWWLWQSTAATTTKDSLTPYATKFSTNKTQRQQINFYSWNTQWARVRKSIRVSLWRFLIIIVSLVNTFCSVAWFYY